MSLSDILAPMEDWDFSQDFAASTFWYPFVESTHIVALALVVGTIFFVDLRLLGLAGRAIGVRRTAGILPFTWIAFLVAIVTGVILFLPQASHYAENPAFRLKMVFLLLAGLNMLAFHFGPWRRVARWDEDAPTPLGAKVSGLLSLAFWIAVVFLGRFVPFIQGA